MKFFRPRKLAISLYFSTSENTVSNLFLPF